MFDRVVAGQWCEFLFEDRLIGGFQIVVPVQELDHVIALVHAVLDQRITRERADDMNAWLRRFECRRQFWESPAILAGEFDAHRFDKAARWL